MSIRVTVNIHEDANLQFVEQMIGELPSYLEKYLWKNMLEVANVIASEARAYAPIKTGMLQASIVAVVTENGVAISCEVPYAKFVELGTKNQLPQLFLYTAMSNHYEDIRQAIERTIHDFFEKVEA
jgi:HK97 gp10 family phage protein